MHWTWHWVVFVPALIIFSIISQFSRGAMNRANIAKYGPRADYRNDVGGAILGCVLAGAIYAAIATAIVGFIF